MEDGSRVGQDGKWLNKEGLLHREDGPAYESASGNKLWYVNGKLHRLDGPAVEYCYGDKEWRVNGRLHRTDGPAVVYNHGIKFWFWVNGYQITDEVNDWMKEQNVTWPFDDQTQMLFMMKFG